MKRFIHGLRCAEGGASTNRPARSALRGNALTGSLHAGVAERLRHSQEFGSALWDATKDYLQKMNLTAEERNQVGDWLHQKKDKFQSKVVEQLHKLHKVDDNKL